VTPEAVRSAYPGLIERAIAEGLISQKWAAPPRSSFG
jgi:hypothetical protein